MTSGTVTLSGDKLIFFVGLNTGYVTDGKSDRRYIDFYSRRSSSALYCAIVGNVVIPGGHPTNLGAPMISGVPEWEAVARAIAERGSLPGIQLSTAWEGYTGIKSFRSPKPGDTIAKSRAVVRGLGRVGIKSVLNALDQASVLATRAGFRHLQVHAAHGYLLNLLVDERLNEHAPEVLDGLAGWARRQSLAGIETSIRISLRTGDVDFDAVGGARFHEKIAELPVDFVDLSSGFYNIDKRLIYPGRPDVLRDRHAETIAVADRFPARRFIMSGRAMLEPRQSLPKNLHIGLCRDLIANPDFLRETDKGCVNSGKCHYFSRGADHIVCARWTNPI
jgi:2,4-dienoyl-CoA reductase-like NADH-dependent reductase (Old Yellow Enzyme family)